MCYVKTKYRPKVLLLHYIWAYQYVIVVVNKFFFFFNRNCSSKLWTVWIEREGESRVKYSRIDPKLNYFQLILFYSTLLSHFSFNPNGR